MKKTRILTRVYGVTPMTVLRRNIFKARHVTNQDYGVITCKVYAVTLLLWKAEKSSRNIGSTNTDGLAAIVSKLDNLGRDMKKLNENVDAIQVGCQICEGPHLDKEFPLDEEVKQLEEVKYGEFRRSAPFNESASVNVMPRNIFEHLRLENLRNTNLLVEMADMTKKPPLTIIENILVRINEFLFPLDFVIIDKTPNETIILGRTFLETIHVEVDVLIKKFLYESIMLRFEKQECDEMEIEIEKYDPHEVQVETFEVRKYSFKGGQKFICVTKEEDDTLPLERRNGSRFKEMIRKEFDINTHDKT
nr:hypothetical protein [Tanacetum cinerariifolium]